MGCLNEIVCVNLSSSVFDVSHIQLWKLILCECGKWNMFVVYPHCGMWNVYRIIGFICSKLTFLNAAILFIK